MKTLFYCFVALAITGFFTACEDDFSIDVDGKVTISGVDFIPRKTQIIRYNKGFEFIFSGSGASITINTKDTINGIYTVPPDHSPTSYHRLEASVAYLKGNTEYIGESGTVKLVIMEGGSMEISINVTVVNIDITKHVIAGEFSGIERHEILDKTTPNKACFAYAPAEGLLAGTEISFTNCSKNATHYYWFFGDDNSSGEKNPTHVYNQAGKYEVILVAQNTEFIDFNGDGWLSLADITEDASTFSNIITILQ